MSLGHGPKVTTSNLLLCLDAGNTKSYSGSGTTWTDISGQLANASLLSTTNRRPTYASNNGGVLTFGQTSAPRYTYVEVGSRSFAPPLYDGFSIEVWFQREGFGTWTSGSTNYDGIWNYHWQYYLSLSGNHTGSNYIFGSGGFSYDISMDTWYHVVVTHDQTTTTNNQKWYVNGELEDTNSTSHPGYDSGTTPERLWVGNWDASWAMVGQVALFRIYKDVLTGAEVQQNFEAQKGRFNL